nr:DUF952 domain-containing protein [Beutenbergia cavernae]
MWHLALADDWDAAQARGTYDVPTRGARFDDVGFVHCSHADQVDGIARAFYADADDLVLLEVDADALAARAAVVVEPGDPADPTSERYPHVYAPVPLDVVTPRPWRGSFTATTAG